MSKLPSATRRLRDALLLGVVLGAALCTPSRAAPAAADGSQVLARRNIVFVLVDDLRYDAVGFLRPGLQTPNIDAIAKQGVYFPNAVVTSSLCSPSRATILTGMTTRNHRIVDNNDSSEAGLVFFPSYLQKAGYQTAFFGKWHMGASTDAPRPGFDKWVSFAGQGTYQPVFNGRQQTLNVDGKEVNRAGYITDELTDYAMNWLEKERDPKRPFLLYLSHKAVHSDLEPAERHRKQYADLKIELPASMANTPENNAGKPVWVRNQRNSWHGVDFPYHGDRSMTDWMREYFRTLSAVDDSLGRILQYLKKKKLENDTLVVFYSDNGFLFGDHGLIDKRNAYEPSVRVPMVAYAPGLLPKGVTNTALVRNLDLAPTFLDVAGVKPPKQFEGVSVLPVASGAVKPQDWKSPDFVYEYYWEWTFPQTPTTFAIRRGPLKYIQYHGVWDLDELYDVEKDPGEMRNLIDDPAYVETKQQLRAALFGSLENSDGRHVVPFTKKTSQGAAWRNRNGPPAAEFPEQWRREPNAPDRANGIFPDTREKAEADREHKAHSPPGRF